MHNALQRLARDPPDFILLKLLLCHGSVVVVSEPVLAPRKEVEHTALFEKGLVCQEMHL